MRLASPSKSSNCLFFKDHKKANKPTTPKKRAIGIKYIRIDILVEFVRKDELCEIVVI